MHVLGGKEMDKWKKDARRDVVITNIDALMPEHQHYIIQMKMVIN